MTRDYSSIISGWNTILNKKSKEMSAPTLAWITQTQKSDYENYYNNFNEVFANKIDSKIKSVQQNQHPEKISCRATVFKFALLRKSYYKEHEFTYNYEFVNVIAVAQKARVRKNFFDEIMEQREHESIEQRRREAKEEQQRLERESRLEEQRRLEEERRKVEEESKRRFIANSKIKVLL